MSPYCSAHDEWLIMKLCMYVGYYDANNVSNCDGDPVTQLNLKKVFVYEIGLIAIREVPPPFDEEQQYGRPYQPKHSPSYHYFYIMLTIYIFLNIVYHLLFFGRIKC